MQRIKDFTAKVVVVGEPDLINENHCRVLGLGVSGKDILSIEGEFSQNLICRTAGGQRGPVCGSGRN